LPNYQYWGVDRLGKKLNGRLEAPNETEVRAILRGRGIRPVRITSIRAPTASFLERLQGGIRPVKVSVLVPFTSQLYVLVNSGIPMVQALDVLIEQIDDRGLKNIVTGVKEKVSGGSYFWESLNAYPGAFPRLYIALIRAGEASGALDTMLKRLSRYLEDADRLVRMVKGAMMYPIFVIAAAIGVISIMLVFVIPKMKEMLVQNNQELPLPTQFVVNLSDFLLHNALVIGGVTVLTIFLVSAYFRSQEGRAFYQNAMFRVPLFGTLMQKSGVARFCRTMSTLLSSGINLLDAIDICKNTVDNVVLENAIGKIRKEVEGGKNISEVLRNVPVFPKMVVQMIAVGESTGNLDKMMD